MSRSLIHMWPLLLCSCIAYNPECPVDTSAAVGRTEVRLDVRRSLVRSQETAVGNLITDAFYDYLARLPVPPDKEVDLALINAGAIRDANECRSIEAIGPGVITAGQLSELLPFDNRVELVEVTGAELLRTLEHSVSRLGEAGDWGLAGQFLQVSHLRFRVDCSRTAAVGEDIIGSRVVDGEVAIIRDDGPDEQVQANGRYQVATNSFLVEGGDGFMWLSRRVPLGELELGNDVAVVEGHLRSRESVFPRVEGRILLDTNCAVAR